MGWTQLEQISFLLFFFFFNIFFLFDYFFDGGHADVTEENIISSSLAKIIFKRCKNSGYLQPSLLRYLSSKLSSRHFRVLTIYYHLPHHPFTKHKALSNSKFISCLTILEYLLTKYFLWHNVSSKRYDMQIFKKNSRLLFCGFYRNRTLIFQ